MAWNEGDGEGSEIGGGLTSRLSLQWTAGRNEENWGGGSYVGTPFPGTNPWGTPNTFIKSLGTGSSCEFSLTS
jgi:hypothetical protein